MQQRADPIASGTMSRELVAPTSHHHVGSKELVPLLTAPSGRCRAGPVASGRTAPYEPRRASPWTDWLQVQPSLYRIDRRLATRRRLLRDWGMGGSEGGARARERASRRRLTCNRHLRGAREATSWSGTSTEESEAAILNKPPKDFLLLKPNYFRVVRTTKSAEVKLIILVKWILRLEVFGEINRESAGFCLCACLVSRLHCCCSIPGPCCCWDLAVSCRREWMTPWSMEQVTRSKWKLTTKGECKPGAPVHCSMTPLASF